MSFRLAIFAFFIFLISFMPLRAADEGARVVLVLDASGSMWGQIDGKTKMEIAKEVVGKVVNNWKPSDELGLVAYGHREKGSCTDIEVVREAGLLNATSYMDAVNALNPKGKTPMTAAVRMAAESLKFTEKKATVILVSDGIETCEPDPCAVAAELEKLGVELTVHTVGFGLDNQGAVAQLKCLAEKTGGTSTTASNAKELEDALNKTVATAPPPSPPPKKEAIEFNLLGHVMMAEGVELPKKFSQPTWQFYKSVSGEKGESVGVEYKTLVKLNVPEAGDYIAHIVADNAVLDVPFKIENGKATELNVSLEAGIVKFTGFMDDATPINDEGAAWALFDVAGSSSSTNYGSTTTFLTNAGTRKVTLALGTAKVERDIQFVAGKTTEEKMSLGAGLIEVSGFFTAGGQKVTDGASIELRKGEADLDGKHEWIGTEYGPTVKFKAPAGKYRLVLIQDYASATTDVVLNPGAVLKTEIVVNAGYLAIQSPADSTIVVYTAEKDLAGNRTYLATDYGVLNKAFSAGKYYVAVAGKDGAEIGAKEFEVKAGARTEGNIP